MKHFTDFTRTTTTANKPYFNCNATDKHMMVVFMVIWLYMVHGGLTSTAGLHYNT